MTVRLWMRPLAARLLLAAGLLVAAVQVAMAQAPPPQRLAPVPQPQFVQAAPPAPDPRWDLIQRQLTQQQRELEQLRQQLKQAQTADGPFRLPSTTTEGAVDRPVAFLQEPNTAKQWAELENGEKKKDGGWTDISGEKWNVKLGGHMQADYVMWAMAEDPPVPAQNYFEFRRLRLLADGVGFGVYDFRLQIDIEPEAEENVATPVTVIKDAYLTMNEVQYAQRIRFGNFFVPFSLEQVTNDTNNIFMERSIPTQGIFSADREVGIATYGISDDQNKTWTFGFFFDSISEALKERLDDNQGQRLSGRLTWLPYYDEPSHGRYLVHTGVGILHTHDQDNTARFRARPQVHEGPFLIDSGILAASDYTVGNIELATVWGPFSVQSEMFLTNVNMINGPNVWLNGAYVYGSWFLTGENRIYERYGQHGAQFARNVPYTNFFLVPGCQGWGAWEAKLRMSYLNLNAVNAGQYTDITVGFNWYWTERIRMMFDCIHPWTTADAVFGSQEADLIAMRLDYNF